MLNYAYLLLLFWTSLFISQSLSANTLTADFRHRPPEMVVDTQNNKVSGPLKVIIEKAAADIGFTIEWRSAPFSRSLIDLQTGAIDVVPRVIRTDEREAFITYLGPISEQQRNILFVTRSDGPKIHQYSDLEKINIGVKRGTAYFEQFDNDSNLRKIIVHDDFNLARMLQAQRIDAIIVLDLPALEMELKNVGFTDYHTADYFYPNTIGNYYGMPKEHPQAEALNTALLKMVKNGEINSIYQKFGLTPE